MPVVACCYLLLPIAIAYCLLPLLLPLSVATVLVCAPCCCLLLLPVAIVYCCILEARERQQHKQILIVVARLAGLHHPSRHLHSHLPIRVARPLHDRLLLDLLQTIDGLVAERAGNVGGGPPTGGNTDVEEGEPVVDTLTKMNKAFFFFFLFFSFSFFRSCFVGTSYCMLPMPIVIESLHVAIACCHCMLPLLAAIAVTLHGVIVCCHCL